MKNDLTPKRIEEIQYYPGLFNKKQGGHGAGFRCLCQVTGT
jgi:hypothetical protein